MCQQTKLTCNFAVLNLILVILAVSYAEVEKSRPLVEIPQGKLEGENLESRSCRSYFSFKGIPYGKSKRFQDPEPADGWEGIRDASKFGEECLQTNGFDFNAPGKITGSEDCLFLNIYTPKLPANDTNPGLPTMMWIHGGGWQFGSGQIGGGKYFMEEDVVLVMINYRLGPFGFLHTGKTANVGARDQILALKWIKQNIQHFGGNPNLVTVFGESAGSGSVSLNILSPLAKGLFHRGISQSGTPNSAFATVAEPSREFRKLGILMDCPTSNPEYLLQCLERIDGTYMLNRITSASTLSEFHADDIPKFLLAVDKDLKDRSYLADSPINLMQAGASSQVPWVSGLNALEGLLFPRSQEMQNVSRTSWTTEDAKAVDFENDCSGLAKIREFYVGNSKDPITVAANVTSLFSDRYFGYPAKVSGILHARNAPTYLYYFSKKGEHGFLGDLNPTGEDGLKHPGHVDELQYLFDMEPYFPEIKAGSKFLEFSKYLVKLWVTFARDGKFPSDWKPVPSESGLNDDIEWFQIDSESHMVRESSIFGPRLNFWNDITASK